MMKRVPPNHVHRLNYYKEVAPPNILWIHESLSLKFEIGIDSENFYDDECQKYPPPKKSAEKVKVTTFLELF